LVGLRYNPEGLKFRRSDDELRKELNTVGYGYFYPQFFICKNGYEQFLNNFQVVIESFRETEYTTHDEADASFGAYGEKPKKRRQRTLP